MWDDVIKMEEWSSYTRLALGCVLVHCCTSVVGASVLLASFTLHVTSEKGTSELCQVFKL